MKIRVIINPMAGGGRGKREFPTLLAKIKSLWPSTDCFLSSDPQGALDLAFRAQSEGYNCLVVAGGDGTVHALLPALVDSSLILGLIPLGGANDLARHWGIPLDLHGALEVLGKGKPRAVDVIETGSGTYIAGAGGIGFDVAVIERASQWRQYWKGLFPFFPAVVLEFFRYRLPWISVSAGDWQYRGLAWQVIFTKISQYALLLKITSPPQVDDGWMQICLVPDLSKFHLLTRLPFLPFRGFKCLPTAPCFPAQEMTIKSSPPLKYHGDGELVGQTPEVFRVRPKALRVMVPLAIPP